MLYNTSMIFKAYDIRGIYGEQLNEDIAYKIGRAFAVYIGSKIVVARDNRLSSDSLFEALTRGITDQEVMSIISDYQHRQCSILLFLI